ncbi:MAG: hypothetical protein AB8E82_17545 [Aureispira sp.]
MEILDQEEQPSDSKTQHYYHYLLSSWIIIMGPMLLITWKFIKTPLLFGGGLGTLIWLMGIAGLVWRFYKKIMRKNWQLPMTILALLLSYFLTVFFMDTGFKAAKNAPIITGFLIYVSHTGSILFFSIVYYNNNHTPH